MKRLRGFERIHAWRSYQASDVPVPARMTRQAPSTGNTA